MHKGQLVETGQTQTVFASPRQDYTQRLVAASRFEVRQVNRVGVGAPLLEVDGVTREYRQGGMFHWREKPLRAVDEVSFSVLTGECLALVGPSGCGKTTLAKIMVGLDTASAGTMRLGGVSYRGRDLPKALRRDLSLVFQDPFGSFNPRLTIGASLAEPLRLEPGLRATVVRERVVGAIAAVGLSAAMLERYPHEFSGGQRQRLAIARSLVTRPKLLVLDEPVSALDVSVRGEVLSLLARLQAEYGLTYVIISHDLDMVRAMADRAPEAIFANPQHRLTRDLVAARLPEIG
jgi:peptide/nickel transport system ATP-binding protein